MESSPLLLAGLFSSIQESASASVVVVSGQVGAGAEIVQVWLAGEASLFPAASTARTRNWCAPAARPVYWRGGVQAAKVAASSAHSKVAPASLEKVKLA